MTREELIQQYTKMRETGDTEQALHLADLIVKDFTALLEVSLKMEASIHAMVKKLEAFEAW